MWILFESMFLYYRLSPPPLLLIIFIFQKNIRNVKYRNKYRILNTWNGCSNQIIKSSTAVSFKFSAGITRNFELYTILLRLITFSAIINFWLPIFHFTVGYTNLTGTKEGGSIYKLIESVYIIFSFRSLQLEFLKLDVSCMMVCNISMSSLIMHNVTEKSRFRVNIM